MASREEGEALAAMIRAWVTFDALSFTPGAQIQGSVENAPLIPILKGSRAPGRFVATVCDTRR